MNRAFSGSLIVFGALACNAFGVPRGIDWSSTFAATNYLSDGTTTFEDAFASDPANYTFTFELGAFVGIDPTSSSPTEWAAAWDPNSFSASYNTLDQNFSSSALLPSNDPGAGGFAENTQAYIWGYNTKDITPETEWILIADPAWQWPEVTDSAQPNITWTVGSAPQSAALFGAINDTGFHMMTANVMASIPEPSVALLLGPAVVALLLRRKR